MKILFIGSSSPLSLIPLNKILQSEHSICAVGMEVTQTNPFYNYLFPVKTDSNSLNFHHLDSFAKQNHLPVITFNKHIAHYVDVIKKYAPDIILVSCFGKKLPTEILSIPAMGCFNLHPSLLPQYRGPTPVFWQFRNGAEQFGVTLHLMTTNFDDGHIIGQSSIDLNDGTHHMQAKLQLSEIAADLIIDVLNDFSSFIKNVENQSEHSSSYYSYPAQEDYTVSTTWSAKRLYNFIKAYQNNSIVFPCEYNNQTFNLIEAIHYDLNADTGFKLTNDFITLPCSSGYLKAKIQLS
jgi:methionyl-tRNA formyltransferase